ncbi:MAG: hypothetical protein RDV48_00290 [Candidatus Eremiobacteraeota bacterium]|nr:hypothetical protein [Candidatus Eremiobacteraeota bacterium]
MKIFERQSMVKALRQKSRDHGIAIPTALFVVMAIFFLVTATITLVNQNINFTRYTHLKTRAYFLAKGAANRFYKDLAETPSYESAHTGFANAATEQPSPDEQLLAWIEPHPTLSNILYIHGRGVMSPGSPQAISQDYELIVNREINCDSITFAVRSLSGPDIIYYKQGSSDWVALDPFVKKMYDNNFTYEEATGARSGDYASNMRFACGDNKGNLYAVWGRSGPDTIYRYNFTTTPPTCDAIKPPSLVTYNSLGEKKVYDRPVDSIDDMITDGKKNLYLRDSRSGVDTIYRLDLNSIESNPADASWSVLPPALIKYYDYYGALHWGTTYAGNLTDIAASESGGLYARYARDGIDTLYRYKEYQVGAETKGQWEVLDKVPYKYYRYESGKLNLYEPPRTYVGNVSCLSCSADGTLYGRYAREGVDTIYRFSGTRDPGYGNWRKVVKGTWDTIEPPTQDFYASLTLPPGEFDDGIDTDPDPPPRNNVGRTAIDGEGKLSMKFYGDGGPDAVIRLLDDQKFTYEKFNPIPVTRFKWEAGAYKKEERYGATGRLYEKKINDLGAGGVPRNTVQYRYVHKSDY